MFWTFRTLFRVSPPTPVVGLPIIHVVPLQVAQGAYLVDIQLSAEIYCHVIAVYEP